MATDIKGIRQEIAELIQLIRGKRVMLDSDLAVLYGVETKQINRAVIRNPERFPEDFYFELSNQEVTDLKYQFGTSRTWVGVEGHDHTPSLSKVLHCFQAFYIAKKRPLQTFRL